MIDVLVRRWDARKDDLRAKYAEKAPDSYDEIVKDVVRLVTNNEDEYGELNLDPERIHAIDDGDYQGTRLFIIGAKGYQPSTYWAVSVWYGSCSGCDTFEGIRHYGDGPPTKQHINDYMRLALYILQSITEIG